MVVGKVPGGCSSKNGRHEAGNERASRASSGPSRRELDSIIWQVVRGGDLLVLIIATVNVATVTSTYYKRVTFLSQP